VQEWLNWQHWKCCEPQKGSVGSNPTSSAIFENGQELEETSYWLELIEELGFFTSVKLLPIRQETKELTAIFVTYC
jgi:hypothetical protein